MAEYRVNKQARSKTDSLVYSKAWLQQARAELAGSNSSRSQKSILPPTGQDSRGPALIIMAGLIVLQAITLLVVLIVTTPSLEPTPDKTSITAALDMPLVVGQQLALLERPPDRPGSQAESNFEAHNSTNRSANHDLRFAVKSPPVLESAAIRLRGLEITQGIQVFQEPENSRCNPDPDQPNHIFCNNSMPMVAGRHTLVRVYLACNRVCPAAETVVRLRLLKAGQEQASLTRRLPAETLRRVSHLSMPELRLTLDHSVNFEFFPPPAWLVGQITFEIEAVPQSEGERWPVTLSLTKDFALRKPLRIAYLPIEYQGLRPLNPAGADYWLLRLYPVPAVDYYRLPVPAVIWSGGLHKGEILRRLFYTYWLTAQYNSPPSRPDQLFGWLPAEFYNGGAADPYWCPNCVGPHSGRVAFGGLRPEQDIGGPRILVHEIAHNLGAQHAWSPTNLEDTSCFRTEGVDIQVDPDWPYVRTPHIQEVGIDLYSDPPLIYPPSRYDMMTYCTQPWISPHTYRKIFDSPFLQPEADSSLTFSGFQPLTETRNRGMLLVSGLIYPDGIASRPEVVKLQGFGFSGTAAGFGPPLEFSPPPGDDYCLDVQASDDTYLARHCFDVGFSNLETELSAEPSPFYFALPKLNLAEVDKVTLRKDQVVVTRVTASHNWPEVSVTFPNGGEVLHGLQTITWAAGDADGDSLLYDVLYSPDGGQSWLPLALRQTEPSYRFYTDQLLSSKNALIRVIVNDGFNTVVDDSDASFVVQPAP